MGFTDTLLSKFIVVRNNLYCLFLRGMDILAAARNKVISGKYEGKMVLEPSWPYKHPYIFVGFTKNAFELNSKTVESYELVTDEHSKSAASGIGRGLIGGALLGPVGLLAGVLSAESRSTYIVAIQYKNGEKSLLEIDHKVYSALVKSCF